jgi:hypothetical protein
MRTIAFMSAIQGKQTPTGRHAHRPDGMNSPLGMGGARLFGDEWKTLCVYPVRG